MPDSPPRLLDQVRENIRLKHYSIRTGHAYVDWVKRFFISRTPAPSRPGASGEVEALLAPLALVNKAAAFTQHQARSALLLLDEEVLDAPLPWLDAVVTAQQSRRLPVVLGRGGRGPRSAGGAR